MTRCVQNVLEWLGWSGEATIVAVAAGCLLGTLAGCAGTRPQVAQSAAEFHDQAAVTPGGSEPFNANQATPGPASELDFFDDLERRAAVSFDDAIHALLLVSTGESAAGYGARVEAARRMGWVDPSFNRPGREAATTGEIARIVVRTLGDAGTAEGSTPGSAPAVRRLQALGILPAAARPESGMTGAQYLGLLANARTLIAQSPSSPARPPNDRPHAALVTPPAATPPAPGGSPEGGSESFDDFGGVAPSPSAPPIATHNNPRAPAVEPDPPSDLRSRPVPRAMPEPLPDVPALAAIEESTLREAGQASDPPRARSGERWAPSHANPAISKPRPPVWVRGRPFTKPVKPE